MKIIQMLHQVLTGRFHKIVVMLTLFVLILCSCNTGDIYEIIRYNSSKELIDVFKNNKDEFKSVLDILDDSALYSYVDEKIHDSGHWDNRRLNIIKNSGLISKEEFDKVQSFFQKFGPKEIDKGHDNYYSFVFLTKVLSSDISYSGITIYYIDDIKTKWKLDATIGYLNQNGEIVNLIDNWYYMEDIETRQ